MKAFSQKIMEQRKGWKEGRSNTYNKVKIVVKRFSFNCPSYRNFRYAAYCNLYFFLYKQNTEKKNYRTALPSCVVEKARLRHPKGSEEEYVGFQKK